MARYKLRLLSSGENFYSDSDGHMFVADTADEAKAYFDDWTGERPEFVHSSIASARVAYKADVDGGDCHEDCEPGDTTYDIFTDDGRELADHQIRVWEQGPPRVWWSIDPMPYDEIKADDIPVGVQAYHRRHGDGRTIAPPRRYGPARVFVDVSFGWPPSEPQRVLACSVSVLNILPSKNWPPRKYRLTVGKDTVAESYDKDELDELRKVKVVEVTERWKAEQVAA